MMETGGCWTQLDAAQAWWAHLSPLQAAVHGPNWFESMNHEAVRRALTTRRGHRLSFVPQQALPPDCAYESFIAQSGAVPTRDNLHDYLNALIWLGFPAIKQQLNQMQAEQIEQNGVGQVRTPLRDALTLFDENAALVVLRPGPAGQALHAALAAHDWYTLFVLQREQFGRALHVLLFGHALLEKLCQPYKAITAHAWPLWGDDEFYDADVNGQRAWVDARVAKQLARLAELGQTVDSGKTADSGQRLTTRAFLPLPVAGVPGWWPGQDDAFYADRSVFRAAPNRARPTLLPLPVGGF
jgi:hypothetical protein